MYKPNQYTGLPDYFESGGGGFVPYTGAIADVDLGAFNLNATALTCDNSVPAQLLSQNDFNSGTPGVIAIGDFTGLSQANWSITEAGIFNALTISSISYTSVGAPTTASNSWLQIYGIADPFISCYDGTGANVVDVKANGEVWINDVTTFMGAIGLAPFGPYGSSTEGGLYEFITNTAIAVFDHDSDYYLYAAGAVQANTANINLYAATTVIGFNALDPVLTVIGAFGQSEDHLQVKNSSSTTLYSIGADGAVRFNASLTPNALGELARNSNALQFYDGTAARSIVNKTRKNSTGTIFSRSQLNFIEGSNVTLTVADDAGNDEIDITIAASGGGGSLTVTETEIDFGTTPVWTKTFTITDAGVSGASKIIPVPSGNVATSRTGNDLEWDNLLLGAVAGTGDFVLTAIASPGPIVGKRKVFYTVA